MKNLSQPQTLLVTTPAVILAGSPRGTYRYSSVFPIGSFFTFN